MTWRRAWRVLHQDRAWTRRTAIDFGAPSKRCAGRLAKGTVPGVARHRGCAVSWTCSTPGGARGCLRVGVSSVMPGPWLCRCRYRSSSTLVPVSRLRSDWNTRRLCSSSPPAEGGVHSAILKVIGSDELRAVTITVTNPPFLAGAGWRRSPRKAGNPGDFWLWSAPVWCLTSRRSLVRIQ